MLRASVDLGSNTGLLLIAEVDETTASVTKVFLDEVRFVRLAEGLGENKSFSPDAMERALVCLREFSKSVAGHGLLPEVCVCVTTQAARVATNAEAFFKKIKRETGFHFQILSGEQEGRAAFFGAIDTYSEPGAEAAQKSVIIDIGGGSTEISTVHSSISAPLGAVSVHDRFFRGQMFVEDDAFWAARDYMDQTLAHYFSPLAPAHEWWAVAGTATTLAQWHLGLTDFDREKIDGTRLTVGDLHHMTEELKMLSVEARGELPGIGLRKDIILAGAMILWRSLSFMQVKEIRVSTRGLRYGVFQLEAGELNKLPT